MRESAATKARRYLVEGRVILTEVTPDRVRGLVRGNGAIYSAGYQYGQWTCDCPAVTAKCCHLIALRLTTAPDLTGPCNLTPRRKVDSPRR